MKTRNVFKYLTCLWDGLGTELPAEDRENWDAFTSGQLADTNKRNAVDLVSRYINYIIHLKSDFPFLNAWVGLGLLDFERVVFCGLQCKWWHVAPHKVKCIPAGNCTPHTFCKRWWGWLQRRWLSPGLISTTGRNPRLTKTNTNAHNASPLTRRRSLFKKEWSFCSVMSTFSKLWSYNIQLLFHEDF